MQPDILTFGCRLNAYESEAMRDLASRGERSVQAYASAERVDFEVAPMVGVDFLLRNGFTVSRPHPAVPA